MAKRKKEPTAWDMAKQVPAVVLEYAKVGSTLLLETLPIPQSA